MPQLTRKEFILMLAGAGAAATIPPWAAAVESSRAKIKLGVTLYSYTGSYAPSNLLEQCIADASVIGAEGVELLAPAHIPSYPTPQPRWIEHWRELMKQYNLAPSCYNCAANSRLQAAASPRSDEAMRMLGRDLELAATLGFPIVRPAWDNTPPPQWAEMARRALPYAEQYGVRLAIETPSLNSTGLDGYLELVDRLMTKRLGLVVDIGRVTAADSRSASERLAELLPHVIHIRRTAPGLYVFRDDASRWELRGPTEAGGTRQASLIRLLMRRGYDGYLSNEYEGPRGVLIASDHLGRQHAEVRELLAQT